MRTRESERRRLEGETGREGERREVEKTGDVHKTVRRLGYGGMTVSETHQALPRS